MRQEGWRENDRKEDPYLRTLISLALWDHFIHGKDRGPSEIFDFFGGY